MTRVAIAIITWNNADDAVECASSLLQQSMISDMEIVFIDNASSDATTAKLKHFIELHSTKPLSLVQTGYNGGTAGGFNAAVIWARRHKVKYIGALNADAVAATPDWCKSLVDELDKHPDTGIATGVVLHSDGKTIDSTGDFYTTWGLPAPRGRNALADHAPKEASYVFGATGGCFVAKTAMYNKAGLYDEKMFMYYEDIDLSFRAQLAGYKVRYTPGAVVYHKRGASADTVPGLATYNTFKNLPFLLVKDVPLSLWWHVYPRFLATYFLIFFSAAKKGRGFPALKGVLMSWWHLPHMIKERIGIQKQREVSDDYIRSIFFQGVAPDQTGLRKFRSIFKRY